MKLKVGILDYEGGGNISSIRNALNNFDVDVELVNSSLKNIDKLILPGVGSYKKGSESINPFREAIKEYSQTNHILGICLGMQLLCKKGFEFGESTGLGLVDGECVKINTSQPLPHIGWSKVDVINSSKLLRGIRRKEFYFMHSYEVINYTDVKCLTDYFGHKIVSVLENYPDFVKVYFQIFLYL